MVKLLQDPAHLKAIHSKRLNHTSKATISTRKMDIMMTAMTKVMDRNTMEVEGTKT